METIYTVDYFIKKFEAIPEELWFVGAYIDKSGIKKCAAGHCGHRNDMIKYTPEGCALILLSYKLNTTVADVNDGKDSRYQQPTPKQRILAALRDIKALQEKEIKPEVKERIVYVMCDAEVRKLQQEQILN